LEIGDTAGLGNLRYGGTWNLELGIFLSALCYVQAFQIFVHAIELPDRLTFDRINPFKTTPSRPMP
jgi:hypothetical protein